MLLRYITRRLVLLVPVLFGITVAVAVLARFAPGDPVQAALGLDTTPEQVRQMRDELGLDDPFPVQYARWLGNLLRGDLGRSIVMGDSVGGLIFRRLPTTLALAVLGMGLALVVSVPLGALAAIRRDSWLDNLLRVVTIVGASMPVFWLGILLLRFFAVELHWLPASGGVTEHGLKALILPSLALSASFAALITRMVRSMMLEVMGEDYVRTARAKGLAPLALYGRHVLRNALIPVVTVVGLQFGSILGGAVLSETIFNVPGLGRLLVEAVSRRDYPMIQGVVLVTAVAFVLVNLLVDLLYTAINPQIRYS